MARRMLIDASHPEETRVVVVDGTRLEEFDFETSSRKPLKGNIYLAKVIRIEPSLQAAFVEYGGNRHGFLAFNEIHPDYYQIPHADREALMREAEEDDDDHAAPAAPATDEDGEPIVAESLGGDDEDEIDEEVARRRRRLMRRYKIQEVIKRRQIMLIQVVKEERGNKGAALTTYLSLAGRYCVLMPNTDRGGGISRKITAATDRKRLRAVVADLDVPQGMGLIVLILVGILPGTYALKMTASPSKVAHVAESAKALEVIFAKSGDGSALNEKESDDTLTDFIKPSGKVTPKVFTALSDQCEDLHRRLGDSKTFQTLPDADRGEVRSDLYLLSKSIAKLQKTGSFSTPEDKALAAKLQKNGEQLTNFIPDWVKYAVALALGLGTMIGYKRIVVTVGEKIGKSHLTNAQGGAAELVAMCTILVADHFGLPVSTTHVLSSGVAGTMAANHSGLQMATLRNILMAWVLTLPVCIFLGALLFAFGLNLLALLGLG